MREEKLLEGSLLKLLMGVVYACITVLTAQGAPAQDAKYIGSTDEFRKVSGTLGERAKLPGAALFTHHCAGCHVGQVYKAPHLTWLEMMPARSLFQTMKSGIMQQQASSLSDDERVAIVEYLLQEPFDNAVLEPSHNYCQGQAAQFSALDSSARTGWGADTARFVPNEVSALPVDKISQLKLKWSFGFPGAMRARSQPTIGMGAIFVGSQDGTVYALDLHSGCVRWAFQATAEVRTGVVLAQPPGAEPLLFFGDLIANLYALDARTGRLVWRIEADAHHSATLTGTPAYHAGKLYAPVSSLEVAAAAEPSYACCTFRGKVLALEAATGNLLWNSYTIPDPAKKVGETTIGTPILAPSGAPVWTSPTIDPVAGLLYFGSGENYSSPADGNSDAIIAIDLETGARRWQRQIVSGDAWNVACMMAGNPNCPKENGPDFDQASSPLLIRDDSGESWLVAGHKDGRVAAYDDLDGSVLWSTRIGRGSIQGGVHFGMAAEGQRVYVPINDMNDTRNGDILDPALARPGVAAVDARSGAILWQYIQEDLCDDNRPECDPGVSAPLTAIPGAVIAGHLDGHLRIFDAQTGTVLWDYNTRRDLTTVNGVPASGGGMSGAGPTVAEGHLVTNSGYGLYFHEPGNALLVFSVDGK